MESNLKKDSRALILERLTWIFGALLIVTIPLRPQLGFFAILFLGLTGIYRTVTIRRWNGVPGFFYAIAGMFIVRLLWIAVASDSRSAWRAIESEGSLIAIPVTFLFLNITSGVRRAAIWTYLAMCTAVVFYSFSLFIISMNSSELGITEFLKIHFENPQNNAESGMLNWGLAHYSFFSVMLLYGIHMAWYEVRNRVEKSLLALFILLSLAFIIICGSTSGFGLFIVGFVCYIIYTLIKNLKMPVIAVLVAAGMTGVFGAAYWLYTSGVYNNIDDSRNMMVSIAVNAVKERPLLGYGTGSGAQVMHNADFEYHYSYAINHPHNQYLSEMMQFGIIGSIPFFIFVFASILYSIRRCDGALFTVLITAFLFMLVESPLNSNKGELPFLFALSLLACTNNNLRNE